MNITPELREQLENAVAELQADLCYDTQLAMNAYSCLVNVVLNDDVLLREINKFIKQKVARMVSETHYTNPIEVTAYATYLQGGLNSLGLESLKYDEEVVEEKNS